MIIEAIRIIQHNPIWGAGPNAFQLKKSKSYLKDETPYYSYPHNVVLEIFVLGGAIMGSALLLSIMCPFVPTLREILHNDQVLALSTSMIVFLVESMVGGDLYDFRLFWYAAILLPVYKINEQNKKTTFKIMHLKKV
jgi:O-antigen ligase